MSTDGQKFDKGKIRMGLCYTQFAGALKGVAKVLTYGARKYPDPNTGDRSWENVPRAVERYTDAFLRHWHEVVHDIETMDVSTDAETGLLEIDHCITNLLFLRKFLYEDRMDDLEIKEPK